MTEHDEPRSSPAEQARPPSPPPDTEAVDLDEPVVSSASRDDSTPLPTDAEGRSFPRPQVGATNAPPSPTGEEREYTGEPVETDEGWVLPQQQNVGPGQTASTADA